MYSRILVSTVPAWSKGSDTISSLFQDYDKTKLSCLYIRADKSDAKTCDRYFHIYEGRVLKSILNRKIITGEEYTLTDEDRRSSLNDSNDARTEEKRYNYFRNFYSYTFYIIREIIWLLGRWNTKQLNQFVDSADPEVFIFPIESYIHFNRINEYIIKKKHPEKVIGFLWDDNFTYRQHPYNLSYRIHRFWLRRHVRRLVSQCDTIFVLSPKMKRECDKEFGINTVLLTKPIFNEGQFHPCTPHTPIKMLYTGKMHIGRDKTILKVSDAIRRVNKNGTKVVLDIYSGTQLPAKMRQKIEEGGCTTIHAPIKQSRVFEKQQQADVLLFVESLSGKDLTARLSFSTKLTDYFSAGKCIWAIGNEDLGPIEYLRYNDSGLVSTDEPALNHTLDEIVAHHDLIQQYALKSFQCGVKNHDKQKILQQFYKEITIQR